LWNGNRETVRHHLGRDSLFIWALQSYPKHQRIYPELMQQPEYQHLTLIRLKSPRAAQEWLEKKSSVDSL
jgi:hypothetical protein